MKVIDAQFSGQGDDFTISGTIQLSDEAGLLPCPFCGGTNLDISDTDFSGYSVAVHCRTDNCAIVGPRAFLVAGVASSVSVELARLLWNTRAQQTGEVDNG